MVAVTRTPDLIAAAPLVDTVLRGAVDAVAAMHHGFDEALRAYALAEPDTTYERETFASLIENIVESLRERYGVNTPTADWTPPWNVNMKAVRRRYGIGESDCDDNFVDWAEEANYLIEDIDTRRIPFFSKALAEQRAFHGSWFANLARNRTTIEEKLRREAVDTLRSQGVARAREAITHAPGLVRTFTTIPAIPPGAGALTGPGMDTWIPVPGTGRLALRVGQAQPVLDVTTTEHPILTANTRHHYATTQWQQTQRIDFPDLCVPIVLDLDRDSGVVTTSAALVNALVLRLLLLLPAKRVLADIVDPARLGESASFLFGLGDAAEKVIGDKVRTTDRELAELLQATEEHITRVTQKYLQGQYASLSEYNVAAGEVAEAYRLLVFYDYPAGFMRSDGYPEVDALARLAKIIAAGPRCGVFTLIVRRDGDLSAPFLDPIRTLPWLTPGSAVNEAWMRRFLTPPGQQPPPTEHCQRRWGQPDHPGRRHTLSAAAEWPFAVDDFPDPSHTTALLSHVEHGLLTAEDLRVTPAKVAALAQAKALKSGGASIPDPDDPNTWWKDSSHEAVESVFGRVGARDIAVLRLDSGTANNALVGGRTGAGKSVWLHAVIASLIQRYAPDELDVYLVDFKEGVEFAPYAAGGLPHARVVAIESDREFGLSVLSSINAEISRRGQLFRSLTGAEPDLATYRYRTGETISRIVLIIDEFHILFDRDDTLATQAAEILDRIIRQGRAFGVHTILASQTIAGTSNLGRHTLNQIKTRIALQSSEADSRLLLADDNDAARLLSRPGEGILNTKGGLKDANTNFQTTYWPVDERVALVNALRLRADADGFTRSPVVFSGREPATVADIPADTFTGTVAGSTVRLPLGLPLTLDPPVAATLRREPGGNLLMVCGEDEGYALLTIVATACAASGVEVDLCDYGSLDGPWNAAFDQLTASGRVRHVRRREATGRLEALASVVSARQGLSEYRAAPRILILCAMHRAREFDTTGFDAGPESDLLTTIVRDGPDVGVHVLAWCDKPISVERRFTSQSLREFGLRLLGRTGGNESYALIGSEVAAQLNPAQMVFDDHDRGETLRLRRFAAPSEGWVAETLRLAGITPSSGLSGVSGTSSLRSPCGTVSRSQVPG